MSLTFAEVFDLQAQIRHHPTIVLGLAAVRGQVIADEETVCAGQEDPALQIAKAQIQASRQVEMVASWNDPCEGVDPSKPVS